MKKLLAIALFTPFFSFGQQFWIVKEPEPGTAAIFTGLGSRNGDLVLNDQLYFRASMAEGSGLWKTDGTPGGTNFIYPFTDPPGVGNFDIKLHQDKIFISARFASMDDEHGVELYISDGTEQGTELLKDINPGVSGSNPGLLGSDGNFMYFSASPQEGNSQLWKSDGTEQGTLMLSDVSPFYPKFLFDGQGLSYFSGDNGSAGQELWKTDGTESGTQMVKDIRPGGLGSDPDFFVVYNSSVYFSAHNGTGRQLFVTDGTEEGTQVVKDIRPGGNPGVKELIVCNGLLFFNANDGVHGQELWATDGTEEGTYMVKDIREGSDHAFGTSVLVSSYVTPLGNELFFQADDGIHGRELWKTDGTEEGTNLVIDLFEGSEHGLPRDLVASNGKIYFSGRESAAGYNIFQTDGTETSVFAPQDATNEHSLSISGALNATPFHDDLVFQANYYGNGQSIMRYGDEISSTLELPENPLLVYPNPTSSILRIAFSQTFEQAILQIYNVNGQLLESRQVVGLEFLEVDVRDWSSGMYVVSLVSGGSSWSTKVVKH